MISRKRPCNILLLKEIHAYDSNNIHILKVGDTVMNIKNMMKLGIVVVFENERNNVLIGG